MTFHLLQLAISGCRPVDRLGNRFQLIASRHILRLVQPVLGDLQVFLGDPVRQRCKIFCHAPFSQTIAQLLQPLDQPVLCFL